MNATATATRKQTEISAPAIFRCYSKTGEVLGYGVPSDSESNIYHVTYNKAAHRYECDCVCGEKHHHTLECKHIKAVKAVVAARREMAVQALAEWMSGLATALQIVTIDIPAAEVTEHQECGLDVAVAEYLRHENQHMYEVLGSTKTVVSQLSPEEQYQRYRKFEEGIAGLGNVA